MRKLTTILLAVLALTFWACEETEENTAPEITSLTAVPTTLFTGEDATITAVADDADGDDLTYTWTATGGSLDGTEAVVTYTAADAAGSYTVTCMVSDGEDETSMDVMLTVEVHTPEFTLYDMTNSDLPANAVYCIDFDNDGNIWFGGQKDAASGVANVSMLSADYSAWTVYQDADLSLDGLEDRVYYMAVDDQNTKWFCTHYGASYLKADGTKGKVDFAIDDYTRTVQVDSEGNIYLSNRTDEGIWFSDDHGANWTMWTAADIGMSSGRPEIYDLRETSDGSLYLLTWYGVVYRDAAGSWHEVSDIAGYYTYAMTMDLDGNMWVPDADTQELYKITGGAVTTFSDADASVLSNPINDLEVDHLGNLWLATDGAGLVRMNTSDFSYSVYDSAATAGAVPEDNITHLEIMDDVIWMSTASEGIVRADYLIME